MDSGKMTYSWSAVRACADKIKSTAWTVRRKVEHTGKCYGEVKQLFDFCLEKTGCCLFETKYSPWDDYRALVKDKESYKAHTKAEMDKALSRCYRYLAWEINGIAALMRSGEVDSVD